MKISKNAFSIFLDKMRIGFLFIILWFLLILLSLIWNSFLIRKSIEQIAINYAIVAYQKDISYRKWNAQFGGVYVPLYSGVEPNPYLEFLSERDIETIDGVTYTLVNPAYMTRMVNEFEKDEGYVFANITSLNPINPENKPDEWERVALNQFEEGIEEVSGFFEIDGEEYFRVIHMLPVEEGCLYCHESQGYQLGEVRGGISVSIPMAPLRKIMKGQQGSLAVVHLIIMLFGGIGIFLASRALDHSEYKLKMDTFLQCFNRPYFFEKLEEEISGSLRYGRDLSVIMFDIDRFKFINDRYGHIVGDSVLKKCVEFMQSKFRDSDMFARYGGDEFVVILTETNAEQSLAIAERICKELSEQEFVIGELKLQISVSMGISALFEREVVSSQTIVNEADLALYRAKGLGKNRVELWKVNNIVV